MAGYVPGYSDRDGLRAALATLAGLSVDVVICSAFYGGGAGAHRIDRARWHAHLDEAVSTIG